MKRFLIPILLLMLAASCDKADSENAILKQESNIESFIKSQEADADTVYYMNGVYRLVLKSGIGDTLAVGDSVSFYYAARTLGGSQAMLFDTNVDSLAADANLNVPQANRAQLYRLFGHGSLLKGLEKGMTGMREGEYSIILFNSGFGYGDKQLGIIPMQTPLMFEILLNDIKKNK